ncbi:MAG: NAD(P)H-hydrate dehydratase [Lachnospirales bacterium]
MYLLTTDEMRSVESYAINEIGVPSIILMENAAKNASEIIMNEKPESVVIFAGKGNNGGDGLAIARHLITNNIDTKIYFIGDKNKATADCKTNLEILEGYNAKISYGYNDEDLDCDLVVDALIGTGLKRRLSDDYVKIVECINKCGAKVVGVDCPTGVNCDSGEDYGVAVNCDITVTFHLCKIGLMLYPAFSHTGKICVVDIGIPYINNSNYFVVDSINMPKRNPNSHKGTYGKAYIVAGSENMAGAAILNCKCAYMVGAGLVNLCTTKNVISVINTLLPEAITTDRENIDLSYGNVCAVGSGLGINYELVANVIKNYKGNIVIDADGLNSIKDDTDILSFCKGRCVITPHLMEMSRLTGFDVEYIKNNLIDVAKDFAKKYEIVVVLKDAHTIITDGNKVCINITGTPAMSKGGSGDCLCGAITGLLAQGFSLFESGLMGAYICGKAGEIARDKYGEYSVMARDIAENIKEVLK